MIIQILLLLVCVLVLYINYKNTFIFYLYTTMFSYLSCNLFFMTFPGLIL